MKVDTLIFDLDDTLYPPSTGVWDAIGVRINEFIREFLDIPQEKVSVLRDNLFHEYGTTLRGLQVVYGIDPYQYLNYVHNIPLENYLQPNPTLRKILNRFDARKTIFTNSDQNHALRVIERLQLGGIFESIIDVMDVAPYCKPMPEAFGAALARLGSPNPETCVVIEDSTRNIDTARNLGFHTVLVGKSNGRVANADACVDSLEDLAGITDMPFFTGYLEGCMKEIPLIAWILIGGLGFIILSSYLSLLSMLRNKNKKPGQFSWINSWRALSRPFEKENQQLSELSEQVSKFKPNNTVDENGTDQSFQSLS